MQDSKDPATDFGETCPGVAGCYYHTAAIASGPAVTMRKAGQNSLVKDRAQTFIVLFSKHDRRSQWGSHVADYLLTTESPGEFKYDRMLSLPCSVQGSPAGGA